jgi:branched-chain amino acid transport system substrate-binding protein
MRSRRHFLAVVLATALYSAAPAMAQESIPLGVNVERTGVATGYGTHMLIAAQIAVDEINRAGGVNGAPLKLVIEDNRSSPEQAVIVTRTLEREKVVAMLGPIQTSQCRTAFPAANRAALPTISPGSSAPGLTAQNRPWTFRISAIDSVTMTNVVEKMRKAHPNAKTVAIVVDPRDAYSQFLANTVIPPIAEKNGLTLINKGANIDVPADTSDFSVYVTRVKSLNPDLVLIQMNQEPSQGFLREANRQKLAAPMFAGQGFITTSTATAAAGVDLWAGQPFDPEIKDPKVVAFVNEFKSRVEKQLPGQYTSPTYIDASAYESIYVLADGLRSQKATPASDPKQVREGLRNYLSAVKDYKGLGNTITMGPEGDALKDTMVYRTHNGKWERQ